jgi:predicted amidohydrolase YtcJ
LTIVDRDLFLAKNTDLLATQVLMTVVDGVVVYDSGKP